MSRLSTATLLVLMLSLAAFAADTKETAQPEKATDGKSANDAALVPLPHVPAKVSELMQDRDYAAAIKAIDEAAKAKDAPRDYLAYLKGRALQLSGQRDAAVEQFTAMEKEFPKSDWARRARFGKAVALAHKGDFRSAELIYRKEVEYLLSAARKQEIADLYLEFADAYFKPKDEVQHKPDHQKALDFYLKALEVGPQNERREEVELQAARCYQLLNQLPEAAKRYSQFVKDHPDSQHDIEARFRLGEVQLAQNQPEEARRTWQDLLAAHGSAKSDRIAEATFNLSLTYGIPNPQSDENLSLGVAALEAFVAKYPDHKLAPQAELRIAQSYIARGRYDDAVKSLTRFIADPKYADRDELADARNLLGRSYQLQRKWTAALEAWREYLAKHPAHSAWSEVQREIVNTEYYMAADKAQSKQFDAARKLWTEFLAKYPLDPRDPGILYAFGLMDFQQEKFTAAIDDWRRLVAKYPGAEDASRGQYMIAVTLETKLGKLDEALKEYRKVGSGSYTSHAQVAIARLTTKSMAIATERIYRSDETPSIKLTSRNIESVTVRAYKVDLETYFRKMHNIHGVEGLDISLIDPDKTFEFKVPKYAEYQELESQIKLPLFKPAKEGEKSLAAGAWAVTVSSKTLEATSLVLQSDLDLIVKSTRDELFVFAENMRTGKPWAGAKLLVSNGQQVFAEAATGADGVFKQSFKELKDAGDVRVFAMAEGCVASNVVSLNGVGVAQGLADKGYIYTDRPAYRAGQLVHVRGVLRRAVDDNYLVEKGKKYSLDVFDARSRSIWQEDVKLSDFGSFHIHFMLPATSPVGAYRVVVHDDEGHSYQGDFQVHEYQLEPVRLTIESDRRVYYRGEQIEGTIRAAFYYGAPLAGREITYQLADGRSTTAKTDDKGEVHFKFPTREFRETQTLPLVATLAERNLRTIQNFFLATQGFSFSLSTVRPVFVAGETFEVTVKATDAEGKPLGQDFVLRVLERTVVDGKVGETEVEQHKLAIDAKTGEVRQTLRLEKGAQYIVRAEGIDRFKNPVTGQTVIKISDDKDQVRLRILADRHTFKVGDTTDVQLHWREAPALALVTFQGARVLDYKLVQLETGANKFTIPMSAKLAPNFDLNVAVMFGKGSGVGVPALAGLPPKGGTPTRRFHEATSPFSVERQMQITLTPKRKGGAKGSIRPGEDVEITIKATDPQGKPISAELSLGMVEQALLNLFNPNAPPINDFFRGMPRESALRTSTSVTFAYFPTTHPIDRHLLNELERQEIAKEEAEHAKALNLAKAVQQQVEALEEQRAAIARQNPTTDGALESPSQYLSFAEPSLQGRHFENSRYTEGMVNLNQVDFDALTHRITSTVDSKSWNDAGRTGSIEPFETNLALVVSQAPEGQENKDAGALEYYGQPVFVEGRNMSDRAAWDRMTKARAKFNANVANSVAFGSGTISGGGAMMGKGPANVQHHLSYSDGRGDQFLADADRVPQAVIGQIVPGQNSPDSSWGSTNSKGAIVVSRDGTQTEWSMAVDFAVPEPQLKEMAKQRVAKLEKLVAERAIFMPQNGPLETGYWNPAIVTDEKGEASITITMPDQSTAWELAAKGVSGETLAGEAKTELTVKKDLFGELKLPVAFTDGDDAQIQATVHNSLVEKGQIQVSLKTTIGAKTTEEKRTVDVTAKGISELSFPMAVKLESRLQPEKKDDGGKPDSLKAELQRDRLKAGLQQEAVIELTVTSGKESDVIRRVVPIRPFGMPVYATAGGSASADTTVWIEPPAQMSLASPSLEILVGPTIERSLLDVLFGPAPACQFESLRFASGIDSTTSDLMAAIALEKLLGATRDASGPNAQALDARVRSAISLLVSSQQDDGGWTWTGAKGASHRLTSARAVWALAQAKSAGYKIADDRLEKALTYLQSQIATTGETDYDSKSVLLQALAAAGRGDFTLANRLYRNRPALSTAALANLALALAEMDHKPMAEDLLALIGQRNLDDPAGRAETLSALPWGQSSAEIRAIYALALEEASPDSPKLKETIDWLMAHRAGHRWSPDKATGPAAAALARWFGKAKLDEAHYKLTVIVNDLEVKTLDVDSKTGSLVVEVPARMLKPGKQRVNFQLAGRGQYTFQAILSGFVAADKLKSTTQNWTVKRHYEPAPLEFDGQEIPRGFGGLQGSYATFRNRLTQLPVGRRGHVELEIWRSNVPANAPEEQVEYLVVTEPLPAGVTVIENSIAGGFERYEINPGSITFYIGGRAYIDPIRFDVHGYLPGDYRAAPTVIRNAYRLDQMAAAEPKKLAVLPLGGKSSDPYRLTPQELYELGKRRFDKREFKQAGANLGELLAKWNVNPEAYKEAARMLLDIHLETGPPAEIVRYFEIIKEKWPELEFPFEKIVKVAAAYHEMGEYERSYLVFRATAESSFIRETAVAGFLEGQGEFLRSIEFMNRLLAEYPPEPYVAAATFALSQRVYAKAPKAVDDPKLREKKINRVDLVSQALAMLENFLTDYPDDPAADQAAFSEANALLELKAYKDVIARATKFAARYPKSDYLDSFWYIVAFGHFALGEHEQALDMAKKVAEAKRVDKQTGREVDSPNKWQAVYIMGQVYHSLGKAAQAIAEYARVEDRFADAKQAIAYFMRQEISLPEVTTIRPGEPAAVELKFRNVAAVDTKLYRIDLMKFGLLKRNLAGITQINLAGIRPFFETKLELGDGKDYRDRTHKITLPLKEEGAYLLVCRGGDLYASGLVLVSPLTVEVQEDAPSGQVRVTVKNVAKDSYVSEAQAKVIGSRNEDFMSGATDLRGVFVAQGVRGKSTVIAETDSGRYAFYRGQTELGPAPEPAKQAAAESSPLADQAPPGDKSGNGKSRGGQGQQNNGQQDNNGLLDNIQLGNGKIQQENSDSLNRIYQQNRGGVKAKEAY